MIGKSKGYYCDGNGDVNEFGTGVEVGHVPALGSDFSYTGSCTVIDDSNEVSGVQWRIKFLTSGVLKFTTEQMIDVFLVGGGGAGGPRHAGGKFPTYMYGGGGGGGYTKTSKLINLLANTSYSIVVGSGGSGTSYTSGGNTTGFNLTANGGNCGYGGTGAYARKGGDGGSGGGAGGRFETAGSGQGYTNGSGGIDGGNGTDAEDTNRKYGIGQGTTTREFGEVGSTLYSNGGKGGYGTPGVVTNGSSNTGNAGSGGTYVRISSGSGFEAKEMAGSGGSGIVIIRNHRE